MIPNVMTAQLGARMHYAVPRILHQAGVLDRCFTDICASQGWPRVFGALPRPLAPAALRRLAGRNIEGVPSGRVTTFPRFGLAYAWDRIRARTATDATRIQIAAGREFSQRILEVGFGDATMVYTFSTEARELLEGARRQGLRTVVEQVIAPAITVDDLVRSQARQFPAWRTQIADRSVTELLFERERAEWAAADLIVCGSEFVRDSIMACGGPAERCVVVPYGVDARFHSKPRDIRPGPLRVLTIGEVGLRKGAPHVLAAARHLRGRAVFRMVGTIAAPAAVLADLPPNVELRGPVPRSEILEHYSWADVFLLPSICEGSATVVYEALSAGLPVICTRNTGSIVTDGVEGYIVPVGDSGAIVDALDRFAGDPALRRDMAAAASRLAATCDLNAYGERLLSALREAA